MTIEETRRIGLAIAERCRNGNFPGASDRAAVIAEIDHAAIALARVYDDLPEATQAGVIELAHALSALRRRLGDTGWAFVLKGVRR